MRKTDSAKKVVFTLRLDEDILASLAAISASTRISRAELVRRAIRVHLNIPHPSVVELCAKPGALDAPWLSTGAGLSPQG
jgi:hypothetical protein